MVELYFLIYRIPKMMIRLARERNRSGLVWTLLAIGSWIGAEIIVALALRVIYATGVVLLDWPQSISPAARFLIYLISLCGAIGGLMLVRRFLYNLDRTRSVPRPPPPPYFEEEVR